jgi:hypothetical protein
MTIRIRPSSVLMAGIGVGLGATATAHAVGDPILTAAAGGIAVGAAVTAALSIVGAVVSEYRRRGRRNLGT